MDSLRKIHVWTDIVFLYVFMSFNLFSVSKATIMGSLKHDAGMESRVDSTLDIFSIGKEYLTVRPSC